jgi:hypothetical protein
MCPPLLAAIPAAKALGTALGTSATMGGLIIAGTAASAAAAGLSFAGQNQAAQAQQAMWNQVALNTRSDLNLKYQQLHLREMQEREAMAQQSLEVSRRAFQAIGFAKTAAGEAGIGGNSVNMLMQDFGRQQAESHAALGRNASMRSSQLGLEALGFQQQGIGNIFRSAPTAYRPSIFSPILQTMGAGLGFMGQGLAMGNTQ